MRRGRARAVAAVLVAVLAAGAGWVFGRPLLHRREDVAERRAAYRLFPTYPGATKTGERSYEIEGDGVGTGRYGLTVTYRLPANANAREVIAFYRDNIPPGWHEATDETCAQLAARMPAPPPSAPLSPPTSASTGPLVLLRMEGELAVFAPGGGPSEGVTFKVSGRFLIYDSVSFACGPA